MANDSDTHIGEPERTHIEFFPPFRILQDFSCQDKKIRKPRNFKLFFLALQGQSMEIL